MAGILDFAHTLPANCSHARVHSASGCVPRFLHPVVYENGGPVLLDFDHHPELVSMPAAGVINKESYRWDPQVCPGIGAVY